jgi:hypothetical protein
MKKFAMTQDTTIAFVAGEEAVTQVLDGKVRVPIRTTGEELTFREIVAKGYFVFVRAGLLGVFDKQHLEQSVFDEHDLN